MPGIGLVLSGGGVRGIAQAGVIQVLEENGIEITHIAGTSAGSIVGSLYAGGHTAMDIIDFFRKTPVFKLSNYAFNKPGILDSDKFLSVFKSYLPEDSYESLEKQLFIPATDMENARIRIFSSGPLIRSILASCAFPMVFSPVEIDGVLYSDGGIINNFPIEPLQRKCDKIIGVYVNRITPLQQNDLKSTLSIIERSYEISIGTSSRRKFDLFNVLIAPEGLSKFGAFNVRNIDRIYEIGYNAAQQQLSKIMELVT